MHEVLAGHRLRARTPDAQGRPLGIVHRDVSPTNIMVSFQGDVKLLDFGIVKATERVSKTREGNVKGNVGYMSPEQARGLEVTSRSDLFSLGLVMFELLSGESVLPGWRRRRDPLPGRHRTDRRSPGAHRQAAVTGAGHPAPRAGDGRHRPLPVGARLRAGPDPVGDDAKGQLAEMMRALFAAA